MKRASSLPLRRGGMLQVSTWAILAGGSLGLSGCDSSEHKVASRPTSYEVESKRVIGELDSQRDQLLTGEVPNNFHIPEIGYYHAAAHAFYDTAYNEERDGKWFVNNAWVDEAGPEDVPASHPSAEALRRIDEALDKQQQSLDAIATPSDTYQQSAYGSPTYVHSHGNGVGSALMMYWMLSGNRGYYSPGTGFSSFGRNATMWESSYRSQKSSGSPGSGSYGTGSSTSRSMTSRSTAPSPHASSGSEHEGTSRSGKSSGPSTRGGFGSTGGSSSGGGSSSS